VGKDSGVKTKAISNGKRFGAILGVVAFLFAFLFYWTAATLFPDAWAHERWAMVLAGLLALRLVGFVVRKYVIWQWRGSGPVDDAR
jgi:Flp pilus assembly protein TadB